MTPNPSPDQRHPPMALQAEQQLLGLLLHSYHQTVSAPAFLRAEHFADPVHAAIYKATHRLIEAGAAAMCHAIAVDPEVMAALPEVGGIEYLHQLVHAVPESLASGNRQARALQRAQEISGAWGRRQLLDAAEQLHFLGNEAAVDAFHSDADAKGQAVYLAARLRGLLDAVSAIASAMPDTEQRAGNVVPLLPPDRRPGGRA